MTFYSHKYQRVTRVWRNAPTHVQELRSNLSIARKVYTRFRVLHASSNYPFRKPESDDKITRFSLITPSGVQVAQTNDAALCIYLVMSRSHSVQRVLLIIPVVFRGNKYNRCRTNDFSRIMQALPLFAHKTRFAGDFPFRTRDNI